MALLPDYEDAPVMKEGFLCPVCLEDFPGINDLQTHFTSGIHDEKPEESQEDSVAESFKKQVQTIGVTRGHMETFSNIRMNRVEWYESQMSKLIQRLKKLTTLESDATTEEQKRVMEKQVVSWVADQDVPLCPTCGRSFNFTRRRHHCRLCGSIMCHPCSHFLDHEEARHLVHSDDSDSDEGPPASASKSGPLVSHNLSFGFTGVAGNLASSLKKSVRRGSTTSLLSVVSAKDPKDISNIRACYDCQVILNRRRREREEKKSCHSLTTFYRKLQERMDETEKLIHVYYKICYSFSMGETVYDLEEAQALRVKLIRLSEEIDVLSRRICTFGVADPTPPPVTQIQLQSKIRLAATNFLKQYTLGLQGLPTQEDIEANRVKRRKEQEERDRQEAQKKQNQQKKQPQIQHHQRNHHRNSSQ